jgi:hypothetical protein
MGILLDPESNCVGKSFVARPSRALNCFKVSYPALDVSDPPAYFAARHRATPVLFHEAMMKLNLCVAFFGENLMAEPCSIM